MTALDKAGISENVGCKYSPLPSNPYDQDIETSGHFLPPGTIAPAGQIWAHTEQPEQLPVIIAFSPAFSIAGQPNLMQLEQPVHRSSSTI